MRPVHYLLWCFLCSHVCAETAAQQTTRIPAGITDIFNDLPIDDPAANSVLRTGEDGRLKIKKYMFVRALVSSRHCYLGEPILLTQQLYSALQSSSRVDKAPSLAGFSVNAMPADNEQVKRETRGGRTYRVFTLQRLQLLPLQQGTLTIDPILVANNVSYKSGKKEISYSGTIEGNAVDITVAALPEQDQPSAFSGTVGEFVLAATADSNVEAGENNRLHIEVSGTGNFASIPVPAILWPEGVEHFAVSSHDELVKDLFPPSGKKIFDVPFVAIKPGLLQIPAVELAFFDPRKRKYRVARSTPFQVHAGPAKPAPRAAIPVTVDPVKTNYPLYIISITSIFVLVWVLINRRRKRPVAAVEQHSAEQVAARPNFAVAESDIRALEQIDSSSGFVTELKRMTTQLLQQYGGVDGGSETLLLQQVEKTDPVLAGLTARLLECCNALLYATTEMDARERTGLLGQLKEIIGRMDTVRNQNM